MSAVLDFPAKAEARPYFDAFAADPAEPQWLLQQRRRALARFAEHGFPSRRGEAWRYLELRGLEQSPLLPLGRVRPALEALPARLDEVGLTDPAFRLVLADGVLVPQLSALAGLPRGLSLGSMASAIAAQPDLVRASLDAGIDEDPTRSFAALNTAFFTDGFVLDAAPGLVLDRPVEIVHLALGREEGSFHTRSLVTLGAESRIVLFESFVGAGRYWRNDRVEWRLGTGAELTRVALIEEAAAAVHLGDVAASLGEGAQLDAYVAMLGGGTVRHEAKLRLGEPGARCRLGGAFLVSEREQANIVTAVDHAAPHGETREIFKGVATGRANAAFQGRITVRPRAQQTDAHMLSRNLLLGPHAAIETKPELEIWADEVKCSHGAAVGDLDQAALFYLLTRGIPRGAARRMLIEAFLREPLDMVTVPALREHLLSRLVRRMAHLEE